MTGDPIRDLRDEVTALRAEISVQDAKVLARLDRIDADIDRLEANDRSFASRSWAIIVLVLTAGLGGLASVLTRSS